MARLITDLPPKLLTMDKSFAQLLRLLQDPSLAVKISSFDLLRRVVHKHVEDLVVEVELDAEEKIEIQLPSSLVKILETKLDGEDSEEPAKVRSPCQVLLKAFELINSRSRPLLTFSLGSQHSHSSVQQ